ncbi:hypothetical protein FHR83_003744 [Actinoplanes campanulatus]|uniref:Uncharacterized protein n=1 Tax=Actinoplanes campanulatus TaxID=113559 RepID=A0A7W5AHZ0_9ACTN|nr:hypothetical protein [Actinoplanes campanulatus]MBB3096074.1 hypothetical protein [Actinoplanes campanulatus]GGN13526.1 hypothetical protein GCM10010109_24580 [Actinoplanes campanulatus]GID36832.1 hypothetical protein Aca09nite_33380 [Actinoplanes campanulatus]
MFWRKQKAAIAGFHPLHQALILERGFAATHPAAEWAALAASLHRHTGLIRRSKWALPPRTMDVILPLLTEICEDLGPKGVLAVTADLRGIHVPAKSHPARSIPVRPPARSATETWSIDPWLRLHAGLRDGSGLDVLIVDRQRLRRVTKRGSSGKTKVKRKTQITQLIKVRRRLPRGVAGVRPQTAPPAWIGVTLRDGERRSVLAAAKLLRLPQSGDEQLDRILTVATETFRWTR